MGGNFIATAGTLDAVTLGDANSEKAHAFSDERSEVVQGGLGQSARRLLPPAKEDWQGGRVGFTLKVQSDAQNYVTVRLWGEDVSENKLLLFCEGKQIGYRHLGDVDILDIGSGEPASPGRFYYNTTPLPRTLTTGKETVRIEVRSNGPIWGYGTSFAQYQKPMKDPTRGVYRVATHTDGYYVPAADEVQGLPPKNPPVRPQPGPEVLDKIKERVTREVNGALKDRRPPGQLSMHLLAKAWHTPWTPAAQNPKAVEKVRDGVDTLLANWRKDPKLVEGDPGVYNKEWFSFGIAGDAVRLLATPLAPMLAESVDDGKGGKVARRVAWADLFVASRDQLRQHRRQYTNQSMITDMNIYRSNRAVAVLDPARALPEKEALRYLYEAIGLEPWLGSETPTGPAKPLGASYFQLTPHGLTRELGFVGYYGEVLDWMTQIYDATRDPGHPGDERVRAQLIKASHARAPFRYAAVDEAGFRAMRAETIVGWRDVHFPGDVTYEERPTWDASPLYSAAATLDPPGVGAVQQMLADGQLFASLTDMMKTGGLRTTIALLRVPEDYATLTAQKPSPLRLPMSPDQPDFVFADEEDGVVAIKNGSEMLYASLYWRARYAVNFLGRVHYILPQFERIAVVREEIQYDPSGLMYKRPDWVNMGFGNGGFRYPGLNSAHAGEELPIAKIPAGSNFKPGQENVAAGRGTFYTLRYGNYLIGMNATQDRTFDLVLPADGKTARQLPDGKSVSGTLKVGPNSTTVVFFGGGAK